VTRTFWMSSCARIAWVGATAVLLTGCPFENDFDGYVQRTDAPETDGGTSDAGGNAGADAGGAGGLAGADGGLPQCVADQHCSTEAVAGNTYCPGSKCKDGTSCLTCPKDKCTLHPTWSPQGEDTQNTYWCVVK
jgi:hypothetical protein